MKIVVGLSGGVDSSVAAYLLKQQGHEVIGVFMINWHDTTGTLSGDCPWDDDLIFAQLVARKLDIPFHTVDLSNYYRKRIVDYMFTEYEQGRTPNPDVLCNREIKWDVFVDEALKLGAEKVATGHYCQVDSVENNGQTYYRLKAGADDNKDQSYFLCQVTQKQLSYALFPIGHMQKDEVRRIALEQDLATAEKKDSQGLCFIGKIDLPTFLQQKLESKPGNIIEIPSDYDQFNRINSEDINELSKAYTFEAGDGKIVGKHNGAHFFTIGQRKGLNVGGTPKPLFVIGTDTVNNVVYVGQGQQHPGLFRKALFIQSSDLHWIRPDLKIKVGESIKVDGRIRYRQQLQQAEIVAKADGLYMIFKEPQRGITPGQFASWYVNGELLGSGVIS